MLLKWIKCKVEDNNKQSFSEAQEKWRELHKINGFLGQIGGWDLRKPFEAGILAFWENRDSYQHFMEHHHDYIFHRSNQRSSYLNINVQLYEKMFSIGPEDIVKYLQSGNVLRIADCCVDEEKQHHFEQMQKDVWNNGMVASPGMLAGVFSKNENLYLVASIWDSLRSHQQYTDNVLPTLITRSGVKSDVARISGNLIELEQRWTVLS
ncbi:YdbC family protein [Bacillaceae bacterium Marseille-Q3522]|nr:YdbC family protein [Bacillaceae bacterium Marseille-Q3522]